MKEEKKEDKYNDSNQEDRNTIKIKLKSDEVKTNKSLFDNMIASNQKNKKYHQTQNK